MIFWISLTAPCRCSIKEAQAHRSAHFGDPIISLDEGRGGVGDCIIPADHLESGPFDAFGSVGAGALVAKLWVLSTIASLGRNPHPRHIPFRADEISDLRLHHHGVRLFLPRTSDVARSLAGSSSEVRFGSEATVMDHEVDGLMAVGAALRQHNVLLVVHGAPHGEDAVQEHGGCKRYK